MRYSRILELHRPSSGFARVLQSYDGSDLTLETFDTADSVEPSYRLSFSRAISFFTTDELTSIGFLPESFEALVEVHGSPHLEDVLAKTRHRGLRTTREFRLMIEGFGASTIFASEVLWS